MIDASTQDPEASAMVRAIIGVARELDIEVVAQGVETEAQRDLRALHNEGEGLLL
jgi:EAL domain-containing protein (putative c-di-GMP-specific phosphodiesterase class I)